MTDSLQTPDQNSSRLVNGLPAHDVGNITTGNITGTGIAIGHGSSVNIIYQHARPTPVSPEDLAAAQQLLASLPLNSLPDLGPLPPGSRLVFARNPLFTGRSNDLQQLARALKGEHTIAAISQVAAATGLGGIGKTQLAVEFAHRYGRYFAGGVFWVSLASADDVKNQIAQCGGAAGLQLRGDYDALKLDEQVALVLSEWQSPLPRLLIFDNCESADLLQQWLPPTGGCRILITSRNAEWDLTLGVQTLALGVLTRAESVELLRKFRPDHQGLRDLDGLNTIAAEVGDLPLALHMVGSYLNRYRVLVADLLVELRRPDLLAHSSLTGMATKISPTGHENHVGRTFAVSYLKLNSANEIDALALKTLAHAACFSPGVPVPRDLLKKTLGDLPVALQAEEAIHRLTELGLLTLGDEEVLALHRLLANFVQQTFSGSTFLDTVIKTVYVEASRINTIRLSSLLRPWSAHLRYLAEQAETSQNNLAAKMFNGLGQYLTDIGDFADAERTYHKALTLAEHTYGMASSEMAGALHNLGELLWEVGRYKEAQKMLERALAIDESISGFDGLEVAHDLNGLGSLRHVQGDYAGAREYFERALRILESQLGANHPDVATAANNLGLVLQAQGDYAGAREYFERALRILESQLGANHPDVATAANNLGGVLQAQGDYAGAREYFERALRILESQLGANHPSVALAANNLGLVLQAQGDYAGAREYFERALRILESQLGANHPDVATAANNLGGVLQAQGDYAGAREYFERALRILESQLGANHPSVALAANNLGGVLQAQGDYAGAREYFERALRISESQLGANHPSVATVLDSLGLVFIDLGSYSMARTMFERALKISEQVLGANHATVGALVNHLGRTFRLTGDYVKARELYERALKIQEQTLGVDHPSVAGALTSMGIIFNVLGDYVSARASYERALRIHEEKLGPDHPDTIKTREGLASLPPAPDS